MARVKVERSRDEALSRALWRGLVSYNRKEAGPFHYSRKIISARDACSAG